MQLKPITAVAVLSLVVASLLVSGCTTTVTNPTTSPPATSVDMTTKLDNAFTTQNYTIIKPFTRAVNQYGNVVYTGTVKDGEDKLVPYVHNMTLEETKSRNESIARFNAYVAQALRRGYAEGLNSTTFEYLWVGNIGQNMTKIAAVRINQPNSGIVWYNAVTSLFDPNYTVTFEYLTKV